MDAVRRVAWLLATTRTLSKATAGMSRSEFIDALRAAGVVLDTSRLSKWESGSAPLSSVVLTALEEVAELPSGVLLALHLAMHRINGTTATLHETITTAEGFDATIDRAMDGTATGGEWLALMTAITGTERVYMHADAWTTLCDQLVSELTRATDIGFSTRYEAAALLVRDPKGQRHLTRSLGSLVLEPTAQNPAPCLHLLSEIGDETAADLVLRLTGESRPLLRRGAMAAAAAMAGRGQFQHAHHRALERLATSELASPLLDRRVIGLDLASRLPGDWQEQVLARTTDDTARRQILTACTNHELVAPDLARSVADTIATRAEQELLRAAHDPDQMLRKLIREALFHAHRDRRHLAGNLLAASPYGAPVAHALVDLTGHANELCAAMAWTTLRRLAHVVERTELLDPATSSPPTLRARAIVTLGLAHGDLESTARDRLLRATTNDKTPTPIRYASMFALGMLGDVRLQHFVNATNMTMSAGAQWWSDIGSAIRV